MQKIIIDGVEISIPDHVLSDTPRNAGYSSLYIYPLEKGALETFTENAVSDVSSVSARVKKQEQEDTLDTPRTAEIEIYDKTTNGGLEERKKAKGVYIGKGVSTVPSCIQPNAKLDAWYAENFIPGHELLKELDGVDEWDRMLASYHAPQVSKDKKKYNDDWLIKRRALQYES